jgi:TetR/AcrR family fatty acid metabolism transcriptional regulator
VPSRGEAKDDRKRQILKAAVEVFAEKGYHGCRISDVAERAGVAYGLVYHYFGNKEALLASIFETNWAVFAKAIEDISEQDTPTQEKFRQIVEFMLGAFELNPLIVKVLVIEFGRNSRLGDALDQPGVARVFTAVQRLLKTGAAAGELREGIDARALTIILLGALEAALASFVIPSPDDDGEAHTQDYDAMRRTIMAILDGGIIRRVDRRASDKSGGRKPSKASKSSKSSKSSKASKASKSSKSSKSSKASKSPAKKKKTSSRPKKRG